MRDTKSTTEAGAFTLTQFARYAAISERELRYLRARGEGPRVHRAGRLIVTKADADQWLAGLPDADAKPRR